MWMPSWNTGFCGESHSELGSLPVQALGGDCHSYGNAAILPASRRVSCKTVPFPVGGGGGDLVVAAAAGFGSLRPVANQIPGPF